MSTSVTAARDELAPTGTLRVGLNLSNFLLTREDKAANTIRGIAPDLAHEIGRRLGVPVQLIGYPRPGKVADDAPNNKWDIAFLGAEPQRAQQIDFTSAYFEIEATYLVPAGSPIKSIAEVDAPGRRIAIAGGSAYDLYLSRELKHAKLERIDSVDGSFEHFVKEKMEVLAGLRPRLVTDAEKLPGSRLLDGRFTAIQQAIGVAKSAERKGAGYAFLKEFVTDAIRNGLVAQAITANGVRGGSVAPLP
ncbi:MAG TPA: transporter substrate-binding domain-containing protein [Burkholderiales bacterium]|jgi:polar amino acid transport system substrate-binding protein